MNEAEKRHLKIKLKDFFNNNNNKIKGENPQKLP